MNSAEWVPATHDGACSGPPNASGVGFCSHECHVPEALRPKLWTRANYLPSPHYYALNMACTVVNRAFPGFGCYLVGSSLVRRDYRDVDVRFIMGDADYDRMFRVAAKDADSGRAGWLNAYWSLLCVALSKWLAEQSGLPIDFQIQRQTQANAQHRGRRNPIGIIIDVESFDYPGELPSTTASEKTEETR